MNHIFYHAADLDGHCSGSLVRLYLEYLGQPLVLHGIDYGDAFPMDDLQQGDVVWMVDWSLQPVERFAELDAIGVEVVLIDHHKTSLPLAGRYAGKVETSRAACELTAEYLGWVRFQDGMLAGNSFGNQEAWTAVQLLGAYDAWRRDEFWESSVLPYQYGLRTIPTDPATEDGIATWRDILLEPIPGAWSIDEVKYRGEVVLGYQRQADAKKMERAFECPFRGMSALVLVGAKAGSQVFASRWNQSRHDLMMSVSHDGPNGLWSVSLYTEKPGLDLSPIAQQFGGGGHAQACGFHVPHLAALGLGRAEFGDSACEKPAPQVS